MVLAWIYVNFGLKILVPGLVVLGVFALMLFFRDVKTPFFYLLVLLLPVFIARYLAPMPDVEHPGLLDVPVLYAYEIPLYLFVFFWFLEAVAKKGTAFFWPRTAGAMALLFVPAVISTATGLAPSYGVFEIIRMFEMLLFFLVVVNYLKTDRQLKIVIILLGLDILLQSLLSVLQFFWPYKMYDILASFGIYMGISHARPYDPTSPIRACGTTGYCNSLAGFFELTVPLFVSLVFFYPMSAKLKRYCIVIIGLAIVALFLTYSRGGLMAIIVAVVALLILAARRFPRLGRHAAKVVLAVSAQLAVVVALLGERLLMRINFFMETMEDDVRIALIRNAFEMIKAKPLFGVGLNNFPEAFPIYEITGLEFDLLFPVHNTWLLVAAEQGLLGLAVFLLFLGFVYLDGRRAIRDPSPLKAAVALGLGAGLVGWFAHNMVAPLYQNWLINRTTFVFVIAVLAVLPRLREEERG